MAESVTIRGVECIKYEDGTYSCARFDDLERLSRRCIARPCGEGTNGHFFELCDPEQERARRNAEDEQEILRLVRLIAARTLAGDWT